MAAGGTLYFDQVQDLTPALQAKLLRVVEEQRFERLGGTRTIEVDVRFVASSNVGPAAGRGARARFREDLYHRLSVVPLTLPPLRERREDILPLAELFLARERERRTTPRATASTREAADALRGYPWPGQRARAALGRSSGRPCYATGERRGRRAPCRRHILEQPATLWAGRDRRPSLKDVEQAYIRYVLEQVEGSQTRAAAILGISRKALWEKRRRYGIP